MTDALDWNAAALSPRRASTPLFSTVTGQVVDGAELDAGYWWHNVRRPVVFGAAVAALLDSGCGTFLVVGSAVMA